MNYVNTYKALMEYNNMSSKEVQDILKPIIKKYNKHFLSEYLGISESVLYRLCKKLFVENNEKPSFEIFITIVMMDKKPQLINSRTLKKYKVARESKR